MKSLLPALLLFVPFTAAAEKPNVLLICVDDLKPAIGCYGDPLAKTPNLDRLAARGIRFDRAYCNQSVCAASRNSLMLGSRPTSIGIYGLAPNFRAAVPDAVTLSQHFIRHGYRAEAVGKRTATTTTQVSATGKAGAKAPGAQPAAPMPKVAPGPAPQQPPPAAAEPQTPAAKRGGKPKASATVATPSPAPPTPAMASVLEDNQAGSDWDFSDAEQS